MSDPVAVVNDSHHGVCIRNECRVSSTFRNLMLALTLAKELPDVLTRYKLQ